MTKNEWVDEFKRGFWSVEPEAQLEWPGEGAYMQVVAHHWGVAVPGEEEIALAGPPNPEDRVKWAYGCGMRCAKDLQERAAKHKATDDAIDAAGRGELSREQLETRLSELN